MSGDADALQRLLVHYHDILLRKIDAEIGFGVRRYLDSEDVLQNAYAAAFNSIGKCDFDGPGGFYAWLEAIALEKLRTAVRDLRRKKRDIRREHHADSFGAAGANTTSYPDLFAVLTSGQSTPSRQLANREAGAALVSSLARLSDPQRAVIRMRFLEDRPVAEIAAVLGKSEDAVYMLCHRGLKSLQDHLGSISRHLHSR
ncbi:MAG: sigma-70 family RNA polymerase sigma factor [Phycisphaerales bacterium]|nr:sigma-70 family RNA polymerase sigma factor [Phycisphaerales bacterium]MCB9858669.1 sigma-70 family RNA polymerase sigma factor [Phycisphaerales bacterium]